MSVKIFPLVFKIKFLLVIHRGPWYTKGARAPVVLVCGSAILLWSAGIAGLFHTLSTKRVVVVWRLYRP